MASEANLNAVMFSALVQAEVAVAELCHGQDPANQCWETLREIRAAIDLARMSPETAELSDVADYSPFFREQIAA